MKKIMMILLAAGAGLLAGCKTSNVDTGAYAPENTQVHDLENKSNFVLFDKDTRTSVTCTGIEPQRLDDGRLRVSANVRNRLHRRIQVQINCEFKDDLGFGVETVPWRDLILDENAQESVAFTSINGNAKKCTIRVRQAR